MTAEIESQFAAYLAKNVAFFGIHIGREIRYEKEFFTPYYSSPESKCINLRLPTDSGGYAHLSTFLPRWMHDRDGRPWIGGAVWYQDFDVWEHQANVAGWRMIERIRAGYGELRPFGSAAVTHFRDDDFSILPTFLLAPLIFGWDAYYIPQRRGSFAHISHDGYWTVVTETQQDYEYFQSNFESYGSDHWIRDQQMRTDSRFCRPDRPSA